jgi:hypothetical protein
MRRFIICLVIALLTFAAGVSSRAVWEKRQQIIDACAEFLRNYQD